VGGGAIFFLSEQAARRPVTHHPHLNGEVQKDSKGALLRKVLFSSELVGGLRGDWMIQKITAITPLHPPYKKGYHRMRLLKSDP
jgi:hypothetical protein